MRQYIVDLIDRETSKFHQIVVLAENENDDMSDIQHFVDHISDLPIKTPVVMNVAPFNGRVVSNSELPEAV